MGTKTPGSFYATSIEVTTVRSRKGTKETYTVVLGYLPAHSESEDGSNPIPVFTEGRFRIYSVSSPIDALRAALVVPGPDGLEVQQSPEMANALKALKLEALKAQMLEKIAKLQAMTPEAYLKELLGDEDENSNA